MKETNNFNQKIKSIAILCCLVMLCVTCTKSITTQRIIKGADADSIAPHGKGNVYAPDIVRYQNQFYLYYGAQAKDGHDRIQLAISKNGHSWKTQGTVFYVSGANHVNDPSVVIRNNTLYMFYTIALKGVTDSIGLATSTDGRYWKDRGIILKPSKKPAWDSLLVGRPSVLYENGIFRMWYDGRADLPIGAPDKTAPKSAKSHRYVGYAESKDGFNWVKRPDYVFSHDAGGIHISKILNNYIMVFESHKGTYWAKSSDGINWHHEGLFMKKETKNSPHGHVTPFIFKKANKYELYFGAAHSKNWDNNSIMMRPIFIKQFQIQ